MKFYQLFVPAILIGNLILVSSCSHTQKMEEVDTQTTTLPPDEVSLVEQQTLTGSFRSVRGVLDPLSCYCSNGGYVTIANGKQYAVSFDEGEDVPTCEKITLTGYKTSRSIESNGVCPAGMMGFLKVQSYVIGETDY